MFSGAITGPIGAGGSLIAKGGSGLVKLGVRAGAGAIAGMLKLVFLSFKSNALSH